jgi:hypothetical protein
MYICMLCMLYKVTFQINVFEYETAEEVVGAELPSQISLDWYGLRDSRNVGM